MIPPSNEPSKAGRQRRQSRKFALQILYAREFLDEAPGDIAERIFQAETIARTTWTPFSRELVEQTLLRMPDLDAAIRAVLEHWRIERLSRVDLLILRLALCEMTHFPDIPVRVTLNEYIELAKTFGTGESSAFVNGILDRLARPFAAKDFAQKKRSPAPPAEPDAANRPD